MSLDKVRDLIELCRSRGIRLVTAESCTGGLIGGALTDIPGSSDVFWGGFLTYANAAKRRILGVSQGALDEFGAVSEEVVEEMLQGALDKSGTELAIAVSGVAGPGGGTVEKPVGTVWIGVMLKSGEKSFERCQFNGDRQKIRFDTVAKALEKAEKIILNDSCLDSE